VKSWFSSLEPEQPWLLIIDNADERAFSVEECIPDSNVGTILVTTRNPMLKVHGTVGPRYLEFQGLDEERSVELLLNTADETIPWIPSSVRLACNIAKTMGYLPLALIHAGKAILARLCTLETYLEFFEKSWSRIRKMNQPGVSVIISDADATIYSSYDLIYTSISAKETQASKDALELLKIMSFLDRQNIRLSIFLRAATNPKMEQDDEVRKDRERNMHKQSRPQSTWPETLRSLIIRVATFISRLGYRPVLPSFLSGTASSDAFDELRLRRALNELHQMSLISTNSGSEDCYSMHAAVHLWARQRPEMSITEQATWCHITAAILSRAILFPPLGDTEEDEIFRRDLLPHVRHVQRMEQAIQTTFEKNRESRRKLLPVLQSPITSHRLVQLLKFSLVYAQGFQLEEAEKLQSYVATIAIQYLGMEHVKTIGILRLLSWTYWQLARADKALELQKQALDASIKVLGPENPETLQIMDSYGSSLWVQGRIPEACVVNSTAVDGLKKTLGSDHVQTLKAMGNLGRAVGKNFKFSEAIDIQSRAFDGLKLKLGPSHSATLEAMDNLAMAYFDRAAFRSGRPGDLDRALELESEVFARRSEKFGREHYYTLWSGLNLARIKAIRGDIDGALSTFQPGHAIVRRDLGETHFIYLFGELHRGRILMCGGRYAEAEQILSKVVDSHKDNRSHHPDRLLAMFSLIKCRNVLGKEDQTASLLEDLTEGTKKLFGPDHEAVRYLLDGKVLSKHTSDVLV
jgi:tetratricopeptide (TPR) repeat protein